MLRIDCQGIEKKVITGLYQQEKDDHVMRIMSSKHTLSQHRLRTSSVGDDDILLSMTNPMDIYAR
jgi:hypothetical protein